MGIGVNKHRRGMMLALTCATAIAAIPAAAAEPEVIRRPSIIVEETAGIRRFGYPVTAVVPLPGPVSDVEHFRLLERGTPVAAQVRPNGQEKQGIRGVVIDFNVNHAPYERREYVLEYGPSVRPGPKPRTGLKVDAGDDEVRVVHPSGLEFVVPRKLLGLLRQVRTRETDYLRPDSPGLMIRYKDDARSRPAGFSRAVMRVVKEGPLAVTLRFDATETLPGGKTLGSVVAMDFPISKSWVQVAWTVDDPQGSVAGLGADVNLKVEGEPTLVDFGAGTLVYAPLRKGQAAMLRAGGDGPAWETRTGPAGALTPYVVAPRGPGHPPAEGWAHVMDRQRCTAVAVAAFSEAGREANITAHADGRLVLASTFARDGADSRAGPKTLSFWLHFVGMPVHVGAATSPQAMLAPLRVVVKGPEGTDDRK
jgi:hypothetical protein